MPDGDENFFGFGLPAPVPYCLECTPHTSTLVFDDVLRPGYFLEWNDFPYPPSLQRDGKYFGEIWMTVAFSPARGARWGTEYCETHIDAHFGVYRRQKSRETGLVKPNQVCRSRAAGAQESGRAVRVLSGRKASEMGSRANLLRQILERTASAVTAGGMKLQLLTRHGIEDEEAFKPQPFSLIITISDPAKESARLRRDGADRPKPFPGAESQCSCVSTSSIVRL